MGPTKNDGLEVFGGVVVCLGKSVAFCNLQHCCRLGAIQSSIKFKIGALFLNLFIHSSISSQSSISQCVVHGQGNPSPATDRYLQTGQFFVVDFPAPWLLSYSLLSFANVETMSLSPCPSAAADASMTEWQRNRGGSKMG